MNVIAAQEIKRRGLAAVDALIAKEPVCVVKQNKAAYVVMREAQYEQLLREIDEAYGDRVAASLEDLRAGRVRRFKNAAELMGAIDKAARA